MAKHRKPDDEYTDEEIIEAISNGMDRDENGEDNNDE